jgi:hypothetical protein
MEWWNIDLERKFPFIHSYVKKSLSKKPLCHHSIFPMMARLNMPFPVSPCLAGWMNRTKQSGLFAFLTRRFEKSSLNLN